MKPVFVLYALVLGACISNVEGEQTQDKEKVVDLEVEVIKKPKFCAKSLTSGDIVTFHSVGKINATGETFVDTHETGKPFSLKYERGALIEGVYEGMLAMCTGEKRLIHVPPHLGYGDQVYRGKDSTPRLQGQEKKGVEVPPNSHIDFEISIVDVTSPPSSQAVFEQLLEETDEDKLDIEVLLDVMVDKVKDESKNKQLPFEMNDQMLAVLRESIKLGDIDGDGLMDAEEFSKSVLFQQDPQLLREIESKAMEMVQQKINITQESTDEHSNATAKDPPKKDEL